MCETRLLAVLGPTNTGKTHFAVERMLAHRSGMIGFPLRLLAREIYDRIVAARGCESVLLVTGEEKIGPASAPYVVATVEAMPLDRQVAFLAIDEVQLAADEERGHIFTDRLLHARGYEETLFLGSETARRLIRKLVPKVSFMNRPRMSTLSYAGECRLQRLPRRSAIVAFSAQDVYALGEYMRRQRGGAAIVLGALSPRTRNAQVELYQNGEVDYLVATDAVGMGLNMDVEHVAFAGLSKFDGRRRRRLTFSEIGQIAGRAGRHIRDGTFGTTHEAGGLPDDAVQAVENHQFPDLNHLRWRNSRLDFSSTTNLLKSLEMPAPDPALIRTKDALDHRSLVLLSRRERIAKRVTSPDLVHLLWQVCQIPDYRKTLTDAHVQLLVTMFDHLTTGNGVLATDWVARMVDRLDRTDGDIDTLVNRIAYVRTWTYISHRGEWLDDQLHWQARTRAVEDRLSDALHDRLTQRFVDRRTSALLKRLRSEDQIVARVGDDDQVEVDGHIVGRIRGLKFELVTTNAQAERRAVAAAARKVTGRALSERIEQLVACSDEELSLDDEGAILWRDEAVGRLERGAGVGAPKVRALLDQDATARASEKVTRRLAAWWVSFRDRVLAPLAGLQQLLDQGRLRGAGRGLAFRLIERLGTTDANDATSLCRSLTDQDRALLAEIGVRFGVHSIYIPRLLKQEPLRLRRLLWRIHTKKTGLPRVDRVGLVTDGAVNEEDYFALGFHAFRSAALRADVAERFAQALRQKTKDGKSFAPNGDLFGLVGLEPGRVHNLIQDLGYRLCGETDDRVIRFRRAPRRRVKRRSPPSARPQRSEPGHAFAALKQLKVTA
ncbi:MAG: helicase-related protein [Geminicoccaceae bacterium]